ncbi:MAG TPA: O-antigen ligase family protein [Anaerohalosphaeraceae bacterium]|nr:O-antigen ligase family protein [Anaerohalosphaeraceae bacterium]
MKKASLSAKVKPSIFSTLGENTALILILGVLVLRSVFIEITYYSAPVTPSLLLPGPVNSLLISFLLLLIFFVHQAAQILRPPDRQISDRLTFGAILFILLGLFSFFAASNKCDALTELTTLAAPLLILPTASELFRKTDRILLFLWVLTALGITAVYQCREQAMTDNETVLRNYEQNPQKVLEELGIEPGTLKQWQFEHRLRSKDVRGFLTTSNSTGSFLLLCIFGGLGLLTYARYQPPSQGRLVQILLYLPIILLLAYGLFLCRSRGAITAGLICLFGWIFCVWQGKRIWPHRKKLVVLGLFCAAATVLSAILYGIRHGRLPGPNAMLVRWQYWVSTLQMIAEHPLRGVGGGNFTIWYPLYKIPAAPELIRDPHNFLLSLAAQYGIPAALIFTGILLLPLWTTLRSDRPSCEPQTTKGPSLPTGLLLLAFSAIMLLIVRPGVAEQTDAETDPFIRGAYYLVFYLAPAGVMLLTLGLLILAGRVPTDQPLLRRALLPALGWGILSVLIHNLIDFAVFETAVLTALMLCLAAVWAFTAPSRPFLLGNFLRRGGLLALLSGAFAVSFYWGMLLPFRAGLLIQEAFRNPSESIHLLQKAEEKDPLSPQPAWYQGQILLQQAESRIIGKQMTLEKAEKAFARALTRNPHDYRLMEAIGDLFLLRAESEKSEDLQKQFRQKSYHWTLQAWEHFPGSDRLAYKLGLLSEQNERAEEAVGWYALAIKIEEDYRRQFQQMYPEYPIFSRLGEGRYHYAKAFVQSKTENRPAPETPPPSP